MHLKRSLSSCGMLWRAQPVNGPGEIIPLVATIFLLIFVANMVKMVPGFESIGYLEAPVKSGMAYGTVKLFNLGSLPVYAIDSAQNERVVVANEAAHPEAAAETTEGEHEMCDKCQVVPFLRGVATDLNFTFALAIIAVLMTQVYGVWSLGPRYFGKFFQFGKLISGGVFGIIDFDRGFSGVDPGIRQDLLVQLPVVRQYLRRCSLALVIGHAAACDLAAWFIPIRDFLWDNSGLRVLPVGDDVYQHGFGRS